METKIDSEFQTLIPPLSDDEYQRLEKSILSDGVREPIITWGGTIIDGHNRYRICCNHGIECPSTERVFSSRDAAKIWIIENQFGRRNLNAYDRAALALKLEPLYAAEAKRRQATSTGGAHPQLSQKSDEAAPIRTDERIAKLAGVSRDTIRKVKEIENQANSGNETAITVREELRSGAKKSIHGAYVRVSGKDKPRNPKDTIAADGRRICAMCGEPINEGEAHAVRPTVHKKCEQEYQRDWEKYRRSKPDYAKSRKQLRYINPDISLISNVSVYSVESLLIELMASAKTLCDSWEQSIEINESMGAKLSALDKRRLKRAASNLTETVKRIMEEKQ